MYTAAINPQRPPAPPPPHHIAHTSLYNNIWLFPYVGWLSGILAKKTSAAANNGHMEKWKAAMVMALSSASFWSACKKRRRRKPETLSICVHLAWQEPHSRQKRTYCALASVCCGGFREIQSNKTRLDQTSSNNNWSARSYIPMPCLLYVYIIKAKCCLPRQSSWILSTHRSFTWSLSEDSSSSLSPLDSNSSSQHSHGFQCVFWLCQCLFFYLHDVLWKCLFIINKGDATL